MKKNNKKVNKINEPKKIKASKRGLTFSFKKTKSFQIGKKFSYIIDRKKNKIFIVPSEKGLTLSRKGYTVKELVTKSEEELAHEEMVLQSLNADNKDISIKAINDKLKEEGAKIITGDTKEITVTKYNPLVDIRNNDKHSELFEAIKDSDSLSIDIKDSLIIIKTEKVKKNSTNIVSNLMNSAKNLFSSKKSNVIKLPIKEKVVSTFILDVPTLKKVAGGIENYEQIGFNFDLIEEQLETSSNYNTLSVESRDKIKSDLEHVYKIISFCSGIGMLDTPLAESKNFEIAYACDYEPSAVEAYKLNVGNEIECRDMRTVKGSELPSAKIMMAGISCKPHSKANRTKRGEAHEDIDLLSEYFRLIKETNIDVFVIENVPELLTAQNGKFFKDFVDSLPEYTIVHRVVSDFEYGGYTNRKRVLVFGSKIGTPVIPEPMYTEETAKTVGDALNKVNDTWYGHDIVSTPKKTTLARMEAIPQGGNWRCLPDELMTPGMLKTITYERALAAYIEECNGDKSLIKAWEEEHKKEKGATQSNVYYRFHLDKIGKTILNWRKSVMMHPLKNLILSLADAKALMGFGAKFMTCGTIDQQQQQLGNGVPYAIGCLVRRVLTDLLKRYEEAKSAINDVVDKSLDIVSDTINRGKVIPLFG